MYTLNKSNIKDYLSDYSWWVKTPLINGEYAFILNNKLMFAKVLQQHKEHLPEIYCLFREGRVLSLNDDFSLYNLDDVISLWQEMSHLVLKPTSGKQGGDVYILRVMNGKLLLNKTEVTLAKVKQFLSGLDDYLVCEYVTQHKYASSIFPDSTNTVRLLMMWDYAQNTPFIALAHHRFGTALSTPVDNISQGGIFCSIDLSTGEIGKAGPSSYLTSSTIPWYEKHPDTGAPIEGACIPRWKATITKLLEIANHIPFIPYIGWDIVITEEGFKILEGNNFPAVQQQMFSPLLKDPRVRKFYKRFNVI